MSTALLVSIIFTLVVAGFVVWLIMRIPMDATIRMILQGVIILLAVWWLLTQLRVPGIPHLG